MQITDVRVRRVSKEGKMKAVVSITLDNEFVVHDIKVIEGEKGLFIAMPSRKAGDGEYRDIAHPINSTTRDKIQSIILEKYELAALEGNVEEVEQINLAKVLKQNCLKSNLGPKNTAIKENDSCIFFHDKKSL